MIDKLEQDYIQNKIQDYLDENFNDLDLPNYIMACNFTDEEEEWADKHIEVSITVHVVE